MCTKEQNFVRKIMLLMDSKHATYESRLASFRNSPFERWTRLKNTKCSPENLAKAGFFYAPTKHGEKTVKCYYCGKMLGDWKRSEDPWEEQLVRNCELFQMYKKYKYDILPLVETYIFLEKVAIENGFLEKEE